MEIDDEIIGVYRQCRRCKQWKQTSEFGKPTSFGAQQPLRTVRTCRPCVRMRVEGSALARSIVITESGRQLLAEWRASEAAVA